MLMIVPFVSQARVLETGGNSYPVFLFSLRNRVCTFVSVFSECFVPELLVCETCCDAKCRSALQRLGREERAKAFMAFKCRHPSRSQVSWPPYR